MSHGNGNLAGSTSYSDMHDEIEAKFLRVDHDELRKRLTDVGAQCVTPERLMRRRNFDYPDGRLNLVNGWVRVRDEAGKITMSYKQLNDRTLTGTKEVNLVVHDFDQACEFLRAIGLIEKSYQESKRESWKLGDVEIELDEWPWVPPYVELEAPSEEALRTAAQTLGLQWEQACHGSVEIVYSDVYDVTDDDINQIQQITFMEVPKWLEARRRAV